MSARRTERGMTVVMFAISITALLAAGALVMGGSNGYVAARSSQTAADAASVAATTTLREVRQGTTLPAQVLATALSVAADNGADAGSVTCEIVEPEYAVSRAESDVIGPCNGTNEVAANAGGVRVRVSETRDVPFGFFVDADEITADSVAAATIQPVRGGFRAPFMLCSFADDHGVDLLLEDTSVTPPTYTINEDAFGVEFLLWANGNGFGDRNCGVSAWHGLVNPDLVYQIPSDPDEDDGWWDIDTGSRVGHIPGLLAGHDTCDWASDADVDDAEGCRLGLPLCIEHVGNGTNVRFNCVKMAVFRITYVGHGEDEGSCASINKKVVCGILLGEGGIAQSGQGTLDPLDDAELVVIKLVE